LTIKEESIVIDTKDDNYIFEHSINSELNDAERLIE